jgi:hypothetical protein
LSDLVTDEVVDVVVGTYVDLLMGDRQIDLVATYASFLTRQVRVDKYIQWLNSLPAHSLTNVDRSDGDAAFILSTAKQFFKDDVLDITRGTVECAKGSFGSTNLSLALTQDDSSFSRLTSPLKQSTDLVIVPTGSSLQPIAVPTVDDNDLSRVDSLRWLAIESEHRNEVVAQINSFIMQVSTTVIR